MQDFYDTRRWKQKRKHILLRDRWIDQVAIRDGMKIEADTVHHILPREDWPQYQWCDWNLISVNGRLTHKGRLHEKYSGRLTKLGRQLMRETALANGVKLSMLTMVIGMPGSGKSTYVRQHLGGGLCYELDSIACAFRLTVPHREEPHAAARRMAASMRQAWLQEARKYSDNIWIVRTAPDDQELSDTMPDRIIVMTKQHVERPYRFSREEYQQQIDNAVAWAEANAIEVKYFPEKI